MGNSNYSALPLTSTAIELQSAQPPPPPKSGASAKLTKQDSFLGEVEDDDAATPGEHDELPLIGDDGPAGPPEGSGVSGAVFNLATSIIGAGIMALPATMKVLGLLPGLVMIVLAAFLTDASVELLMRFSRVVGAPSYGAVMGDAFGWWGRRLLQVCVVVNNVGVMIVYMIIIGKIISAMLSRCYLFSLVLVCLCTG